MSHKPQMKGAKKKPGGASWGHLPGQGQPKQPSEGCSHRGPERGEALEVVDSQNPGRVSGPSGPLFFWRFAQAGVERPFSN